MRSIPDDDKKLSDWLYEEFYTHHSGGEACDELAATIARLRAPPVYSRRRLESQATAARAVLSAWDADDATNEEFRPTEALRKAIAELREVLG